MQTSSDAKRSLPRLLYAILNAPSTECPSLPSIEVVRVEAAQRASKTLQHWNILHEHLLQYEDVLRKRWIKKTVNKRKEVLLSAWPNMPASHRPDFDVLLVESHEQRVGGTRFHREYLYPYINIEDLVKPKNLLLLLHCRGHNQPPVFAAFDLKTQQLGRRSSAIQPGFMEGYAMETSLERYGEIVPLDSGDRLELLCRGVMTQPGDGLLLLEIQDTLLQFLISCAKAIVHDNPTPQSAQTPPLAVFDAEWPSVVDRVIEAPYRMPVECDISRMLSLVNAKVEEAEEYIWALREDPAHFRICVHDWSEHDPAILIDRNGKRCTDSEFWNRILRWVVVDPYQNLVQWHWLQQMLSRATELRINIPSPDTIPFDYEQILRQINWLIREMRTDSADKFIQGIFSSIPLRQFYIRDPPQEPDSYVIGRRENVAFPVDSRSRRFFKLLDLLWDPWNLEVIGMPDLLDELERVTRSNTNGVNRPASGYITAWIAAALSNLAVVSEMGRQLQFHQPRIMFQVSDQDKKNLETQKARHDSIFVGFRGLQLVELATPLDKFAYPSEKRRTATSTAKMREAERHLDMFWRHVDEHYLKETGTTLADAIAPFLHPRTLERTPPWVEQVVPSLPKNTVSPENDFAIVDIEQRVAKPEIPIPRIKIKTRSIQPELPPPIQPEPYNVPTPTPTIEISKRAQKVFAALFYDPTQDPPGEIPWSDFLYAFASIDFGIEKQHGSGWVFTPPGEPQRTIIFHEPHPNTKIPVHIARRHGRRLSRAYGWTKDTFVLKE